MPFALEITCRDLTAIAKRAAAVVKGNRVPITEHVLLSADSDGLTAISTCLDHTLREHFNADGSGSVCIPALRLAANLGTLDQGAPVRVKGDGQLELTQGRTRFVIPTLPADDFPAGIADDLNTDWRFNAPAADFAAALNALSGTVHFDKTRPYLSGTLFSFEFHTLVGTDGVTLGEINAPYVASKNGKDFICPEAVTRQILDLCEIGDVQVAVTESAATFDAGPMRLRTLLIDGRYPDYKRVVPTQFASGVRFSAGEFLSCLTRASCVSGTAEVTLSIAKDEITMESRTTLGEVAADACPCEHVSGEGIDLTFRPAALRWAVESLGEAAMVELAFNDPGQAVVCRRDKDSLRVVMPKFGK